CSAARITRHAFIIPFPVAKSPGRFTVGENGTKWRNQYLSTMSMTAQKKIRPVVERLFVNFIRVRNQYGEGLERQPAESAFQVVGLKIVAVVNADDPYALPSPFNHKGVVYKKANPQILQRVYDFRAVVISKHS